METDNELLREYAHSASEAAFAELVHRHLPMVFSAALREMSGDADTARELAQLVFIELSRKAATLVSHPILAGWLYTSVRWMAANTRRAEDRRQHRQLEYQSMSQIHSSDSADDTWQQVRPVLDDTLHELDETDRAAIVLRFFEELSLKQVGTSLGVSENAASMRVDRALGKLQDLLSKRGIRSTSSALVAALVVGAISSPPTGLAATITTKAIGAATPATATNATLLKSSLALKKTALAGVGLVFVFGTIGSIHFIWSHPGLLMQLHNWLMR